MFKTPHARYLSFNEVLRQKFGEKVYRVSLNLGLSCPNIDGTRAKGGCYFCNDDYLLAKSWHKRQELKKQWDFGVRYMRERHAAEKFIAYFQNGTNTHAPVDLLAPVFRESLEGEGVVGLAISTRPDCLGDDILDLLSELNEKTYLWIELGLQSFDEGVLQKINRAHSVDEFFIACERLAKRGLNNCTHLIFGLPDDTPDKILFHLKTLNALPIQGIKIHNLFVTEHTPLAKWYRDGLFAPWSLADYSKLCVDYLEGLRPDIIVHRLNAHGPARLTVAPDWAVNKLATMNAIHDELVRRDTWQGKFFA